MYNPADVISEVTDNLGESRYSAFRLLDGTFWDDPKNVRQYSMGDGYSRKVLLDKIREFDSELNGGNTPGARRLLLQTILIKYLEDRGVFPSRTNWFGRFRKGANSFLDILRSATKTEFLAMLQALEEKFNGDIFTIDAKHLRTETLRTLATLATKNIDSKGQMSFWDLYSFEHVPVEFVSQVYQDFARKDTGSVYTPVQLVDLILHQTMPFESLDEKTTLLDPTCGSGVFLVSGFKRICHAIQKKRDWEDLPAKAYVDLLSNSIYGVDSEKEVVELTAFSLMLAVCDALRPEVIWSQLRFRRLLGSNLLCKDFFESVGFLRKSVSQGFTYVVGNPPFKSSLTNDQEEHIRASVPDRQLAYAVLSMSRQLLHQNGSIAMIQPSGFLYLYCPKFFEVL